MYVSGKYYHDKKYRLSWFVLTNNYNWLSFVLGFNYDLIILGNSYEIVSK